MTKQLFLKRFLANPGVVGALLPSSPALCREITDKINIEASEAVVELGSGTGVITDEILARINPQAKFIAIEIDEKLYNTLRKNRPHLNIVNDTAENLPDIMEVSGITNLNTIVSGLPWAAFPDKLQVAIINAIVTSLSEGGYFTTFAYLQGLLLPAGQRFRKLLKKRFSKVTISRVVWTNFPPAIVYRCKK